MTSLCLPSQSRTRQRTKKKERTICLSAPSSCTLRRRKLCHGVSAPKLGRLIVRRRPWGAHSTFRGARPCAGSKSAKRGAPLLLAYSGEFLPRSREWPVNIETTGWWFLDEGAGWTPPPALEAFLAAGPPPVHVGFGSMAFEDSQATLRATLAAIKKVGARAILSAGWGGLTDETMPDTVFAIDEAPHDWLFPRMAAIVHHGGAGTVGAAVRAGKPSVVTPFIVDQFPWARLLEARGVAPAPIPHRTLTAEALGEALTSALHDQAMRRRAEDLGEQVRAENGVGRAVAVIERVGDSKRA